MLLMKRDQAMCSAHLTNKQSLGNVINWVQIMKNIFLNRLLKSVPFDFFVAACLLGLSAQIACADTLPGSWPNKPIRMVLGFSPGGPTDIVARLIAQKLALQLGQQVIVDNKPGAGGNIAAETVAKAAPDGYTIFYNTSAIVIGPALYDKVNYDPVKDFAPVIMTVEVPLLMVVNNSVPVKSFKEFIALAKSKPGAMNYSSSGTGTITHLAPAMISTIAGIQTQHVPYKGSAPGLVDLYIGQTQFMVDTINTAMPYVKDSRLKALAVTSLKRTSVLPDVPTVSESGLPGFEVTAWQGIVVPSGTPTEIINALNGEVNKTLLMPEVKAKLAAQGAEAVGGTPDHYASFIKSEIPRWFKAVKDSGAKAE